QYRSDPPDCLVCIESFGYVFAAPLAYLLGVRLVLARRQGKLPREKIQQERSAPPDCLVCIESFGYVFGAPLAYLLGVRLVLARRQGKLPREKIQQDYVMCYASNKSLEIHGDSI